ncbi:MAG: hypothetical protein IJI33_03855 [Solobacterium sp.]|nr:hypothetical protein [Solobacterium sp.]MBQ6355921.1 hypothetical protein [Solobacterium sp.]MBQ6532110.1 hypothetical protein [Solobacterium sp.]MBR0213390.1 hypothetical protein [Solobacterium sp.]
MDKTAELIVRDIAYSPTERLTDMLPVILLAAAVIIVSLVLIRRFFRK